MKNCCLLLRKQSAEKPTSILSTICVISSRLFELIRKLAHPAVCIALVTVAISSGIAYGCINHVRNDKQELVAKSNVMVYREATSDELRVIKAGGMKKETQTTSAAEPTNPKQQVVAVELFDVISQFFPEGSVPHRKSLADAQSKAKAVSADKCYERFEKGFLNDDLTGSDYITLVSVYYSNVQSDTPEALCEVAKGENIYYFRLIF